MFTSSYSEDYRTQVTKIASGSNLYHVLALSGPNASKVHIGDLVMTSKFTDSYFGDKYLFFKHQSIDEDYAFRPDWKPKTTVESAKRCPFSKTNTAVTNYKNYFMTVLGLF